jgi:OOP family OmpA-OmpF porin
VNHTTGKLTGKKVKVTVDGTATWTPGDVRVAKEKGGVVSIASTREYNKQMAATIIGLREFNQAHPEIVKGILRASLEAGGMIQQSDEWLRRAASINVDVYGEQDADYWVRYYKGVTENDAQGVSIRLGGSRVINAAQAREYYGLGGGADTYRLVYQTFASVYAKAFPSDYNSIPEYKSIVNTSYLDEATSGTTANVNVDRQKFQPGQAVERVVGDRNWAIEFDTGKASFKADAYPVLDEILAQLSFSDRLAIKVNGFTDDVGDEESNFELSKRRAQAVVDWLKKNGPSSLSAEGAIQARGFGEANPIAPNGSAEGRQKNRRVQVVLGTVGE